ncbi:O-antigen/teichoic acid export membrane protein [Rhizobium sp. BK376]|nr:O-antigen/teichoic acid export membrane protein [Rhizobium sp. BK376]
MIVFVLLARLVSPAEFGIASSAFLLLNLLMLVSEFGFGDALNQRPGLEAADVNVPFFLSMGMSIAFACVVALTSHEIARQMGVDGLAPYLVATAAICPFLTLANFQDAMYRRAMMFRPLAMRTLAGIVAGGVVGIVMALLNFGTWALIGQYAAQVLLNVAWLWSRPVWLPSFTLRRQSGRQLSIFGLNIVIQRLIDFVTLRSVDFIILLVYGPASLALFTVSSRLNLTLLQLLQSGISGVGTTMLSKIADDIPRLQRLYVRTTSICALFGTPIFVGLAATAPEVNRIMFGERWAGAEQVMLPILLVGGVYCILFINGSYLVALGKPQTLLWTMVLKAACVLPPLYFIRMNSVSSTAILYCVTLILETPFVFHLTLRALSLKWSSLARPVGLPLLACFSAFILVYWLRESQAFHFQNVFLSGIAYGAIYAAIYLGGIALLAFDLGRTNIYFIRNAIKR